MVEICPTWLMKYLGWQIYWARSMHLFLVVNQTFESHLATLPFMGRVNMLFGASSFQSKLSRNKTRSHHAGIRFFSLESYTGHIINVFSMNITFYLENTFNLNLDEWKKTLQGVNVLAKTLYCQLWRTLWFLSHFLLLTYLLKFLQTWGARIKFVSWCKVDYSFAHAAKRTPGDHLIP